MKIIIRDRAPRSNWEGYLFLLLETSNAPHQRATLLAFGGKPLVEIISRHAGGPYLSRSRCDPSDARLLFSWGRSFRLPIFRHFQKRAGRRLAGALSRRLHVLTPSSLRCECSVRPRRPPQPWHIFGLEQQYGRTDCTRTGNEDAEGNAQKRAGRLSLALSRRLPVLTPSSLSGECSVKPRRPRQSK